MIHFFEPRQNEEEVGQHGPREGAEDRTVLHRENSRTQIGGFMIARTGTGLAARRLVKGREGLGLGRTGRSGKRAVERPGLAVGARRPEPRSSPRSATRDREVGDHVPKVEGGACGHPLRGTAALAPDRGPRAGLRRSSCFVTPISKTGIGGATRGDRRREARAMARAWKIRTGRPCARSRAALGRNQILAWAAATRNRPVGNRGGPGTPGTREQRPRASLPAGTFWHYSIGAWSTAATPGGSFPYVRASSGGHSRTRSAGETQFQPAFAIHGLRRCAVSTIPRAPARGRSPGACSARAPEDVGGSPTKEGSNHAMPGRNAELRGGADGSTARCRTTPPLESSARVEWSKPGRRDAGREGPELAEKLTALGTGHVPATEARPWTD